MLLYQWCSYTSFQDTTLHAWAIATYNGAIYLFSLSFLSGSAQQILSIGYIVRYIAICSAKPWSINTPPLCSKELA